MLSPWHDDTGYNTLDSIFTAAIRKELVVDVHYFEFATEISLTLSFPLGWFYTEGAQLESEVPPALVLAINTLCCTLRLVRPDKQLDYKELDYFLSNFNETIPQDLAKIRFSTNEA